MSSKDVPACACTCCGYVNDRAFSIDLTDKVPKPGDATLCETCGHVMLFADDLTLRDPTAAEQRLLDSDFMIQLARLTHAEWVKVRPKH